jgi:hypothetical protein
MDQEFEINPIYKTLLTNNPVYLVTLTNIKN